MKKLYKLLFVIIFLIPILTHGQDSIKTEKAFKLIPLISSSPLMGFGFGGAVSYLYRTEEQASSKSQLQIGGQYSNTESYNIFIKNNAWFKNNSIFSSTKILFSSINNEFDSEGEDVSYNVNSFLFSELLMFKVANNIYIGGPITYKSLKYNPNNEAGEDFLFDNGVTDEKTGGFGFSASFDNRKNKYYPSDATFMTTSINTNPSWLGSVNSYYSFVIDARHYAKGFTNQDVWAFQFYGQYSSEKTPDTGLPTLSGKTLLRGFPAGQFKAKYVSGAQTEYRYTIGHSRFRITSFVGGANLAGGSYGLDDQSRDDDGWYYAGGIGGRYAIQAKSGVDIRLDLVRTSVKENALYLTLNQAF